MHEATHTSAFKGDALIFLFSVSGFVNGHLQLISKIGLMLIGGFSMEEAMPSIYVLSLFVLMTFIDLLCHAVDKHHSTHAVVLAHESNNCYRFLQP